MEKKEKNPNPLFGQDGFGKKRREREGKKINSFVWLEGIGVKERKPKEANSSMTHHILSSQIGRKMEDKREYLWWDPPIRCVSLYFFHYKPNKGNEKICHFSSLSSPFSSLLSFPFCFTKHSISERKRKEDKRERKHFICICLKMGRKGKYKEVILCLTCKGKRKENFYYFYFYTHIN